MQPPTGVPGKLPPSITAEATEPSGEKVTVTWPEPVGPSAFLHDWTLTPPSAAAAAPRSNGAVDPPEAGAGAALPPPTESFIASVRLFALAGSDGGGLAGSDGAACSTLAAGVPPAFGAGVAAAVPLCAP